MPPRIILATLTLLVGCARSNLSNVSARPAAAYPFIVEGAPNTPASGVCLHGTVYDHGSTLTVVLRSGTVNTAPTANGTFNGLSVDLASGNPDGKWYSEAQSVHRRLHDLPLRGDSLADSVVFTLPAVPARSLAGRWIVVHEWRVAAGSGTARILSDRPISSASTIFDH